MLESISPKSGRAAEENHVASLQVQTLESLLRDAKPNGEKKSRMRLENQSKISQLMFSEEDSDLSKFRWHLHACGYAMRSCHTGEKRCAVLAHRVVMERIIGRALSRDEIVDHISHERLDNRRGNLRLTNKTGNAQNLSKKRSSTSRFFGVSLSKRGKWTAGITLNGKHIHIGTFSDENEAACAYNEAAKTLGFLTRNSLDESGFQSVPQNIIIASNGYTRAARKRIGSTSKYRGVHFCKFTNKWRALIGVNRKNVCLGRYKTEIEAAIAYNEAAERFGFLSRNTIPKQWEARPFRGRISEEDTALRAALDKARDEKGFKRDSKSGNQKPVAPSEEEVPF